MIVGSFTPVVPRHACFSPATEMVSVEPTHTMSGRIPCHQYHPPTHAGTHIDAPFHRFPGGETIDGAGILDACVGEAVVLSRAMGLR